MKRLQFTNDCRPKEDDIIMCCTKDEGHIYCGVVGFPCKMDIDWSDNPDEAKRSMYLSIFINERETDVTVDTLNIKWWYLLPLTKKELYTGEN